MSSASKPILCVDFDGVIHSYTSGWQGATVIPDPPVPGAIFWLFRARELFEINIYSSRSKHPGGIEAMKSWLHHWNAKGYHSFVGAEYKDSLFFEFIENLSFPTQKPSAFLTIDDRAIRFDGDWKSPDLDPKTLKTLLKFKPWNKK